MGGHGGLNILPQKEWNVYNWDNRITVEKDKRLAREKQEKDDRDRQRSGAQARIDLIKFNQRKNRKNKKSKTPSPPSSVSASKSRSRSNSIVKSKLTQELKEMNKSKHINFFEQEEEQIGKIENNKALMEKEQEYFKEQPFDMSSKFLGTLNLSTPWYMKQKELTEDQKKVSSTLKKEIESFKKQEGQYYQVLEYGQNKFGSIEVKPKTKELEDDQSNKKERKEKKEKKKDKSGKKEKKSKTKEEKVQKLAKQLKRMLGSDSEDEKYAKYQRDREKEELRKQRLAREKLEREREQKLVSQVYQFGNN